MNVQIIKYLKTFSIITTIILVLIMFFGSILNALLIKFTLISFYTSIITSGLVILKKYATSLKPIVFKLITIFGCLLIIFLVSILFSSDLLKLWELFFGLNLLFILIIQLNILGWSKPKHHILYKTLFFLAIVTNTFLASIFFFNISLSELKPIILIAIITSFVIFIIGVTTKKEPLTQKND